MFHLVYALDIVASLFFVVSGFYFFLRNTKRYINGSRDAQALFTAMCAVCVVAFNLAEFIDLVFLGFATSFAHYVYSYSSILFLFFYCYNVTNIVSLKSHRKQRHLLTVIFYILALSLVILTMIFYPVATNRILDPIHYLNDMTHLLWSSVYVYINPIIEHTFIINGLQIIYSIIFGIAVFKFSPTLQSRTISKTEKCLVVISMINILKANIECGIVFFASKEPFTGTLNGWHLFSVTFLMRLGMWYLCYALWRQHSIRQSARVQVKIYTIETIKVLLSYPVTDAEKIIQVTDYIDAQADTLKALGIKPNDVIKAIPNKLCSQDVKTRITGHFQRRMEK